MFGIGIPSSGIPNPNYNLSVSFSLPFGFNFISQKLKIDSAKALSRRQSDALDAASRQVKSEVYSAYISLENALRSYEIAARKEEISQKNLEMVEEHYRQGIADVIRLAQSRLDYVEAQVERAQALNSAIISRLQYLMSAGDRIWGEQ